MVVALVKPGCWDYIPQARGEASSSIFMPFELVIPCPRVKGGASRPSVGRSLAAVASNEQTEVWAQHSLQILIFMNHCGDYGD